MNLARKIQLLFSLMRSLPRELVTSRQAIAYRYYLAQRYPYALFDSGCIVGGECEFGEGVHVENRTKILSCSVGKYTNISFDSRYLGCRIGAFCSLGPQVFAGLGMHPTSFVSTSPAFYSPRHSTCRISFTREQLFVEQKPIIIGSDVWIGARVTILDGVTVGHGAIVAAGAVVTKDVAPYSIIGGIPGKIIRMRFSDELIADLLEIRWWEKSTEWITRHADEFLDVERFVHEAQT